MPPWSKCGQAWLFLLQNSRNFKSLHNDPLQTELWGNETWSAVTERGSRVNDFDIAEGIEGIFNDMESAAL